MHRTTFEYLIPTDPQIASMNRLRLAFSEFASILLGELPDGPDKTFIMRELRTIAMWCNTTMLRTADGTPREQGGRNPQAPLVSSNK